MQSTLLDPSFAPEWEELEEAAQDALEYPADSFWRDDELWNTHTLVFSTPSPELTDEYVLGYANYRAALEYLTEHYPGDAEEATFGHWTYSQFVAVKVRVRGDDGELTEAYAAAMTLAKQAEDYAILDEVIFDQERERVELAAIAHWADWETLDPDTLQETLWELGGSYYPGDGWEGVDEDEVTLETRRRSNTWEAHYYGGQWHTTEHCSYCERALEGTDNE